MDDEIRVPDENRVAVGLSGGVDSAVAASVLLSEGFFVVGVYLSSEGLGPAARDDAEATAKHLGIPFHVVDIEEELKRYVEAPFVASYLRGETPNPCIRCNRDVKFPALLRAADQFGCRYAATGHYARTERRGAYTALLRGHPENDQSYMLSWLSPAMLNRVLFPLGGMEKAEVRRRARTLALPPADKPDSMEICFIPDNDHAAFIEKAAGPLPEGDFVDEDGNVLGRHHGIVRYTVGMRRGLGIPSDRRLFVKRIDTETNRVVLGPVESLFTDTVRLRDVVRLSREVTDNPFPADVRVRHSKRSDRAEALLSDTTGILRFVTPIRAPAAGQTAALYRGDELLASGVIDI
ncbi:tRNA 2-thiouridine(34) synthase MnmA [Oscillospiraceae bacterium OttesenSCG-928-G22]|nr:tRNA 2-thiouridine(34) synthase MnmA [Oscillospiraceae bacterium OttesenSCG-928-G22]